MRTGRLDPGGFEVGDARASNAFEPNPAFSFLTSPVRQTGGCRPYWLSILTVTDEAFPLQLKYQTMPTPAREPNWEFVVFPSLRVMGPALL